MNKLQVKNNEQNFDMQTLMNITGQNAIIVQNINHQLGVVVTTVNTLSDDVNAIKTDVENLKLNEEVTTIQQENIMAIARRRIIEILGTNELNIQKYFRIFIRNLYADSRKYASLGSKISETKKRDYQRVIDYIEAWTPRMGIILLKLKADEKAEARRIAKEQGYVA